MEFVLSGDKDEQEHNDSPLSLRVSRVQEHIPRHVTGKVEVYDMGMTARIPTEFKGSYLIYKILGHEKEAVVVSPDGGIAESHYFKPVKELVTDTGRSGCFSGDGPDRLKNTDEDTSRYWLLRNPEFRKELAAAGWLVFPEVEEVREYTQKRLGLTHGGDRIYQRQFKLRDFIRALELVTSIDKDKTDYSEKIRDFQEVLPFGEEIAYLWEGGDFSSTTPFFHMSAKHKDTSLLLRLEGEMDDRHAKKTLARAVLLDAQKLPGDLTTLARDYAKQREIKIRVESEDMISVRDREYDQDVEVPDTTTLLEQALDLQSFIGKIRQDEAEDIRKEEEGRLNEKREKYGLKTVDNRKS